MYAKLDKLPHANLGEPYYLQAWGAYKTNDAVDAADLAARAAALPGPFKAQAQELYADAWFRQNDFQRAKANYIVLRKTFAGAERQRIIKKIKQFNAKLGLPEAADSED